MKNIKTLLFLTLLLPTLAMAQQEYMITHYMFNGLSINPAYAGVHEGISASLLWREQWVGFDGAPQTQMVSMHSPLADRSASLGAVIYRDQLGISKETGAYFSYAYRIHLNNDFKLSMGLQANTHNYLVDYSSASVPGFDDEGFGNSSQFLWNVGFGAMLHSERAYIGISVPQMMNRTLQINDPDGQFTELVRHYYLTAGYAFNLTHDLVLKPNVLVKAVENAPVQVDLNANVLIKSLIWAGVSYRSMDSLDGLLGIQINPNLMISYATDFTLTEVDAQSHEVMLNFIFGRSAKKIVTPRYF